MPARRKACSRRAANRNSPPPSTNSWKHFRNPCRLCQFWAAFYGEINRETKYFDALGRLFDLYLANDQLPAACESFEKLVEIDPYDSRNQERFDLLQGRAPDEFLSRVKSRLSNAATHRLGRPFARTARA